MLKLYYHPLSPAARRVWITLLEKALPFELIELRLDGDQFQPEFLAINPFHHVPALVDEDLHLFESLAILDYLETAHPIPAMLPTERRSLALVRMVEMVTVNELAPAMRPLVEHDLGMAVVDSLKLEQAHRKTRRVLQFFEQQLDDHPYFGGKYLTLADVVAGVSVPRLATLGFSFAEFPRLQAWCDRLQARPSWQETEPSPELLTKFAAEIAECRNHAGPPQQMVEDTNP